LPEFFNFLMGTARAKGVASGPVAGTFGSQQALAVSENSILDEKGLMMKNCRTRVYTVSLTAAVLSVFMVAVEMTPASAQPRTLCMTDAGSCSSTNPPGSPCGCDTRYGYLRGTVTRYQSGREQRERARGGPRAICSTARGNCTSFRPPGSSCACDTHYGRLRGTVTGYQ
jgi:hypothetical protein